MSKLRKRGRMVYIDYYDQWGLRHKESLGLEVDEKGRYPIAAMEIKKRIDAEVAFGARSYKMQAKNIKLSELLKEYKTEVGSTKKKATKYLYTLAVNTLIDYMKDVPVRAIDKKNYVLFREWLIAAQGKQNASRCIRSLSPIFGYAEVEGYMEYNPINKWTKVKAPNLKPVIFTPKELDDLWQYLTDTKRFAALAQLKFLLYTGFRSNESCTIKWEDIDYDRSEIWHYDEKDDDWHPYPMVQNLRELLEELPAERELGGFVFHYRSKHSLDKIMDKARVGLKKAGKPLNPKTKVHTLKKNYVRSLIDAGLPQLEVHKLSHHKSFATTLRSYATFGLENQRDALKKSQAKGAA